MQFRKGLGIVQALVLISLAALLTLGAVPTAHAATITLSSSGCSTIGGSWDAGTSTCTLGDGYEVTAGNTLEIPAGTTLVITEEGLYMATGAVLVVQGTVIVQDEGIGIALNEGTIENSGTISIESSTVYGIQSSGTITNSGTISIGNTLGVGISNNEGTITNTGTIEVDNSGYSTGITNNNVVTNSGTIDVTNGEDSVGIENVGTITNVDCGTIDTAGAEGTAISNVEGGTVGSSGTCTIASAPTVNACEAGYGCYTTYAVFSVTQSGSPVGGATVDVSAVGRGIADRDHVLVGVHLRSLHVQRPAWTAEWGQYWGCSAGETEQFVLTVGVTYSYTVTLTSGTVVSGSFVASNPWTVSVVSVTA